MKIILKAIIFSLFLNASGFAEVNFQQKKFYYENLVKNWSKIFPDKNRNAAGPRFFKYLIDQNLTYEEFKEYNKFYCPVSGSLINPGEKPDYIFVKELKTEMNICGNLYRCCWPCSCDLMNYAKVKKIKHKFKDGTKKIDVLLINNPCSKKDFPKEVNKNGAPARGATITLTSNLRKHSKTIDSGSGYLCQMEPVAHYGIRNGEKNFEVQVKWTNGKTNNFKITETGKTYTFKQS